MYTRYTRNGSKQVMKESSLDSFESTASPLHLEEASHVTVPNAIPARSAGEHVDTSRQVLVPLSIDAPAQPTFASI